MTNIIGALLLYTFTALALSHILRRTLARPTDWTGPLTDD